jgi:MtN3 and saliva related transmembrane protein
VKEAVAWLFGVGMGLNALLFLPQAVSIWRTKRAEGVSLVTFGGFNVLQSLGVLHGALEHDWSLALGMALSLCACGSVTILALIYRRRTTSAPTPRAPLS